MSFVNISKKDNLILVDYTQLTNMAIRLRKEILSLRLGKVFVLLNFILESKKRLILQGKWIKKEKWIWKNILSKKSKELIKK